MTHAARRGAALLSTLSLCLVTAACSGGGSSPDASSSSGTGASWATSSSSASTSRAAAPAPTATTDASSASGATSGTPADPASGTAGDDAATTSGVGGAQAAPGEVVTGRPVELTLAATGDLLSHSRVNASAEVYGGGHGHYDYTPMFADVKDLISSADLAICHMETPLSPTDTNLSVPNILVFNTPHELATAVKGAGWDGCDFASNHTMDQGLQGLADTEQVIRDAGLGYAGPSAHENRAGKAEVFDVHGVTVAHLAYTYTYPNSGSPTMDIPGDAPWLADAHWPSLHSEGILRQARAAKKAGADFVVVSMHWGAEYQNQPTSQQRIIARALLESPDVDLVLGTHVHVIQPCEKINGKHVIYGMGNFLSNQTPMVAPDLKPDTQEGMVALFTLRRDDAGAVTTSMRYQPTRVEIPPQVVPGHVIRMVTPQSYPETWRRTTTTVDSLGGCDATPLQGAGG